MVREPLGAARAEAAKLPVALVRTALGLWRLTVSPLLGPACRFEPSCSRYADQALARHGLVRGLGLALVRVSHCHPWNAGGYDPVPEELPRG